MAIAVVFNPISGSGRAERFASGLRDALEREGWIIELVPTERAPASEWLEPHLPGKDAVVVVGGDGAVRLVAPEAARAGVPLWHAPCGTENLFARAFGMSRSAADLSAALRRRATREIDLAAVEREGGARDDFVIMASVGFDAAVVHALSATRRGGISHLSYARPIIASLGAWRPSRIAWTVDGEREDLGEGMVVVGNLPDYGARLNPAAGAVCDDGELDAVFIPARAALDLLPWVPLLWTGLHRRHPLLRERRGRRIELLLSPQAELQLDGDAAPGGQDGRLAFSLSERRLSVLVPA
jgi:diacylglycerol kinase family enzyme